MNAVNSCKSSNCCSGVADVTPRAISSPPGLDAVGYRIGAQGDFKAAMLDALSRADAGPLRALQTREDDDFTVALIDGWATALDVLTFYQERLANESWLGTAADRRSLVELGRLIGYEPHPGLAAETPLAFTLEDAAGAPSSVTVDAGLAVQSIPAPGEQPVTFETVESLELRPAWNTVLPRQYHPVTYLDPYGVSYWIGTATPGVKPGDLLMVLTKDYDGTGKMVCFRCLKRVTAVTSDHAANRTLLEVENFREPDHNEKSADDNAIIVLGVKAAGFGHNAPQFTGTTTQVGQDKPKAGAPTPPTDWTLPASWNDKDILLDREYDGISHNAAFAVIWPNPKQSWDFYRVNPVATLSMAAFGMSARVTQVEIISSAQSVPWLLTNATFQTWREITFYVGIRELPLAGTPASSVSQTTSILLDQDYFVYPVNPDEFDTRVGSFPSAFLHGRRWILQGQTYSGDHGVELLTLESADTVTVVEGLKSTKLTHLTFTTSLGDTYLLPTVTLTPNVVRATHGETVGEILGAGNGGQPWQQFTLRQGPVTFTGDGVAVNGASTLEIQANGLIWREQPSFIDAGPNDRVFTTTTDENARTRVRFGDGRTGARLPSGVNNVRAIYRKGSGAAGNVRAGQLSLLGSRPAGVRAVTNPLPAAGGVDPETRDEARVNVPVAARTFDRVVSLQDYADYARAFAGIARARARENAGKVLLSLAGPGGADLFPKNQAKSPAVVRLASALRLVGDPTVPVQIVGGRLYPVTVHATLRIAPDRVRADVLAAARGALLARFGFEHREIGDLFARIDVLATLQQTPGVLVATITKFDYPGLDDATAVWPEDRGDHGELLPAWIAWLDETLLEITAS